MLKIFMTSPKMHQKWRDGTKTTACIRQSAVVYNKILCIRSSCKIPGIRSITNPNKVASEEEVERISFQKFREQKRLGYKLM